MNSAKLVWSIKVKIKGLHLLLANPLLRNLDFLNE